jgi:peptide/nickel transport system substrate-binding protein
MRILRGSGSRTFLAAFALLVLLVPAQSAPAPQSAPQGTPGGRITYVLGGEPPSLDPHTSEAWFAFSVTNLLYDQLVVRHRRTGAFSPGLAESWQRNGDATQYTFKLRRGVKFHDGTPFNAQAVKFSFDRILSPQTKSPAAAPLLGDNIKSTDVVDDMTVRFVMKRPYAGFLDALTLSYGGITIVSPAAVQRSGQDFGQRPVGTGPFMFKEWIPRERIVLVRNPDYNWAPEAQTGRNGPAYLEEVTVRFVIESTVRTAMLTTGQADMIYRLEETDAHLVRANQNLNVIRIIRPGTGSMMQVNTQRGPTDDVRVRRALMHVINMDEMNRIVYNGEPENAVGVLAPNTVGYTPEVNIRRRYPLDNARAAALLDEAGWRVGAGGVRQKDGQPLRLVNICFAGLHCRIGEVMQSQVRPLGIQMEVRALGQPANIQATQRGEHHLRSIGWGGTDAAQLLHFLYHSSNIGTGWNFTFYKDAKFDQLLTETTTEMVEAKRLRQIREIQRVVLEQAISIPIFYYTWMMGTSKRIDGAVFDQTNALPLLYNVHMVRR